MITVTAVLLVAALICFLLSAVGVVTRLNLQSLGLFFWALSLLIR
jgi:hypothetical protein